MPKYDVVANYSTNIANFFVIKHVLRIDEYCEGYFYWELVEITSLMCLVGFMFHRNIVSGEFSYRIHITLLFEFMQRPQQNILEFG